MHLSLSRFPLSDSNRCVFQGWGAVWLPMTFSRLTIGQDTRLNDLLYSLFFTPFSSSLLYLRICSSAHLSAVLGIKFIRLICLYLGHSLYENGWFGWGKWKWNVISKWDSFKFTSQIWIADSKESNEIGVSQQTAGWRLCLLISITRPYSTHTHTNEGTARKQKLSSTFHILPNTSTRECN